MKHYFFLVLGMFPFQVLAQGDDSFNYKPPVDLGDTQSIFSHASGWLLSVIGIVAVIMIILGGIQYATAMGDAEKIDKAKRTIKYTLIGISLGILAFGIVPLIVKLFQ